MALLVSRYLPNTAWFVFYDIACQIIVSFARALNATRKQDQTESRYRVPGFGLIVAILFPMEQQKHHSAPSARESGRVAGLAKFIIAAQNVQIATLFLQIANLKFAAPSARGPGRALGSARPHTAHSWTARKTKYTANSQTSTSLPLSLSLSPIGAGRLGVHSYAGTHGGRAES